MTSRLATNARLTAALDGSAKHLLVDKTTGVPIEGQVPVSYSVLTGVVALTDPFYQVYEVASAAAITINTLRNFVGRIIYFKGR